jgi:hypothetical protein
MSGAGGSGLAAQFPAPLKAGLRPWLLSGRGELRSSAPTHPHIFNRTVGKSPRRQA